MKIFKKKKSKNHGQINTLIHESKAKLESTNYSIPFHMNRHKGVRIYVNIPKGLGEDKETGEAERIGGMLEEKSASVAEIGRIYGRGVRLAAEEAREVWRRNWIVEEVLTEEEIAGVEFQRSIVHVERRAAQTHHPKRQRVHRRLPAASSSYSAAASTHRFWLVT